MPLRSNRLLERAFRAGLFSRSTWLPTSLGSSLAAWYKADAGCYTDAACLFASASSQYLSKTSPTFAPTTKMTIRSWVKLTSSAATQCFASRCGGSQNQFLLNINSGGGFDLYFADSLTDAGGNVVNTSAALVDGVGSEVVIVYDGTLAAGNRVAVYVDGVAVGFSISGTIPATLTTSTAALLVGVNAFNEYLDGALARLGFSSDALSGAALTAAHTSTFWADMTAARQADWFSFYNLCEASSTRVDSTGLNNLTPTNGPTVAAGPGEGLAVNNSPVKRWEDQSGNARHLLQATIANQPLWIASAQNGRPAVRADGTNDYLRVAFTLAQPTDVYFAGRVQTVIDNKAVIDGASANGLNVRLGTGPDKMRTYAGNFGPTTAPADLTVFHAYRFLYIGAASIASHDANADGTGDAGTSAGDGLTLCAYGNGSTPSTAEFGEVFVATAAVAAPTSPKAYLKSRWATP
jgi:hypothetical protein